MKYPKKRAANPPFGGIMIMMARFMLIARPERRCYLRTYLNLGILAWHRICGDNVLNTSRLDFLRCISD
jgi:hypothetical protein